MRFLFHSSFFFFFVSIFKIPSSLPSHQGHLLRLGHGQKELETEKDFSKFGRVNYLLEQRMKYLGEVERLADRFLICFDCFDLFFVFLTKILSKINK